MFLKYFSYNAILVVGKLLSSFIISKVSAVYLGPSGYAIVGNLKNVIQAILGVSVSGFESGVIKHIAENKKNDKLLNTIISSVVVFSVAIAIVIGIVLFFFANILSEYILKDTSLASIFKLFGCLLPLTSLNFLVVYILNGKQKLNLYAKIISITNVLNAFLTFLLIYYFDLHGALLASVIIPAISFLLSFLFKEIRIIFFTVYKNIKNVSMTFIKSISIYILMASYSSLLISLSYLLVRNEIIEKLGIDTAGLWEAMNKISMFYMVFFSSLFTLYLLPQLAINKTISGYYSIMKSYFKYLIPLTCVGFLCILLSRSLLIKIFLTDAFQSIEQFFYLQLVADFTKIIAFSLAYQFHAKKMVKFYFITDAILYISFYLLSLCFIRYFDLQGVFYAYVISTICYLVSVSLFIFFNNKNYLETQ
ncbi:O-antigen translocase [Algibacter sp. L4_22]|uniref:O-antigen translocase n=1 Tax=Algibacter sp. L4_22 TaxID=2942477 RepID=UPI00201B63BD|nr:O-antigen translocase [Algibacter sp. L4_22]MCL5129974.1 O-antigen translocase [Algibacter sp. L4_22]